MWINRISPGLLSPRVDCEYYEPEVYRNLAKLAPWHPRELGEFVEDIRSEPPIHTDHYADDGLHIISPANFGDFFLDLTKTKKLAPQFRNAFSAFLLQPGRLIFALVGDVGHACVVPQPAPDAISYRRTANLKLSGIDSHFVSVFLNTDIGACQLKRLTTGVIQAQVRLEDSTSVLLPTIRKLVQEFIGDKVRNAERLAISGNRRRIVTSGVLAGLLNQTIDQDSAISAYKDSDVRFFSNLPLATAREDRQKHHRVSCDLLDDRIDSWFYKTEFVQGADTLRQLEAIDVPSCPLSALASVGYGFMPTEDYWSAAEGAKFLRVTNMQDNLRVDVTKVEFVNPEASNQPKYKLAEGDVVCVQCGNSTGRIALVTDRYGGWVFPSFALRVRLRSEEWDSGYVAAYMASALGQSQIQRTISITSVRPNTTKPAIESILIPRFRLELQNLIGESLRSALRMSELAMPICIAAKILLRGIIEREITEDELSTAQMQLQSGDETGDRAILGRLHEGGIDATDTPPLFPDLDAYYATLQMAEQELAKEVIHES